MVAPEHRSSHCSPVGGEGVSAPFLQGLAGQPRRQAVQHSLAAAARILHWVDEYCGVGEHLVGQHPVENATAGGHISPVKVGGVYLCFRRHGYAIELGEPWQAVNDAQVHMPQMHAQGVAKYLQFRNKRECHTRLQRINVVDGIVCHVKAHQALRILDAVKALQPVPPEGKRVEGRQLVQATDAVDTVAVQQQLTQGWQGADAVHAGEGIVS